MGHKNYPMSILFFQFILTISLSLIITCESQQQQPRLLACDPANRTTSTFRFCNTSLSIRDRVNDLIGRLTVQEKILWLVNNAAPVPRLGILRIEWWSEALHGVSNTGPGVKFGGDYPGATSFPQVITTAASFNVSMWEAIGQVVSDEARAMFNGNKAGLTYWSPNVNIFRDPRWGRGQETPGEDPLLTSRYAISYVSGMQGNNSNNSLKVAACCKHFTAYDLDNWNGTDRSEFNAIVSQQDLEETYNMPFKACVTEAKVASVMCSFNEVNGIPTCANPTFLRDTIRAQWHLDGYIVSDCDAVDALFNRHHYTSTAPDAAAATIKAGLDMECGPFLAFHTGEAIKSGKLTVKDVDQALANTLRVQMRLGVFDGLMQQYLNLGPKNVCTPAHQQLALEAAQQGIVLLQNNNQVLPLSTIHNLTVAVIGPNSNATFTMTGNYDGVACNYTSPLQGISRYANTTHEMGCANVSCDDKNMQSFERAENLARGANVTVLVMGLSQSIECEGKDRRDLLLPGHQQELVSRVASASSGPVILVLMSGGPIDVTFAKQDPNITSILWVGYPGQAGGAAIADALFGYVNPGGKLPMTWYPQDFVTKVPMTDMNMHANMSRGYPGRTYRFYNGLEVYSFGYGLSYTSYKQTIAQAPTRISVPFTSQKNFNNNSTMSIEVSHTSCETLQHVGVHIDVENIGKMDGTHTVMVFASTPQEFVDDEIEAVINKRLVAFEKIHVATATKQRVKIDLDVCDHLSMVDKFGIRRIPVGEHILHIGENLKHTITLQR